jgi:glycosyltransferase involved in cell wall biosynthesis
VSGSFGAAYDSLIGHAFAERDAPAPCPLRPHSARGAGAPRRLAFLYLGRGGGLGQFTRQLAQAAGMVPGLRTTVTVAACGRVAPRRRVHGAGVWSLPTRGGPPRASIVTDFWRARRALLSQLAHDRPAAVVTLMPHIWTPLLAPAIRRLGVRYVTVAHDAAAHPGDPTGILTPWLLRDAKAADLVVTLSRSVADRIVADRHAPPARVVSLFHPDLNYSAAPVRQRRADAPLRLLFFGRILKYKGLPLLIEAVERLRAEGVEIQLGVAGSGSLNGLQHRLAALRAEVINRWVEDDEVGPLLARYDAIALSHIEASQSGVAAIAFGHCMPVVGMPVGGLKEQVTDGRTGVLAGSVTAEALAAGIRILATRASLYDRISAHLKATGDTRSMHRFIRDIVGEVERRFESC